MAKRLEEQMKEVVRDAENLSNMLVEHKRFMDKEIDEKGYNEAFNRYRSEKLRFMRESLS